MFPLIDSNLPKVDISDLRFIVESQSTCTKEAMTNVVRELEVLESEELNAGAEDSASRRRVSPSLRYHFTLIRFARG